MWFLLACSDHEGISVKEEDPGYTVGDGLGWRSVSVSAYSGCAVDRDGKLRGWGDGPLGDSSNCELIRTDAPYAWVAEGRWGAIAVTEGGDATLLGHRGVERPAARQGGTPIRWARVSDLLLYRALFGTDSWAFAIFEGLDRSVLLPSVPGTPETVTLPGDSGGGAACLHWIGEEQSIRSACVDEPYTWPGSGRYVEVVGFADGLCALREDGDTECDLFVPLPESPPSGLHGLTAIGTTLCGIQEDGYPWCTDVSGVDAPVAHPPPIPLHSLTGVDWTACGLDDETHIVCWGDNRYGQRDPP